MLNDSGNWTVTGGTFNPDGGTVFLTGTGTTTLTSGNKPFANLIHSGPGTVNLAGTALTIGGTFVTAPGPGNFRTNNLAVTIGGLRCSTAAPSPPARVRSISMAALRSTAAASWVRPVRSPQRASAKPPAPSRPPRC